MFEPSYTLLWSLGFTVIISSYIPNAQPLEICFFASTSLVYP
jgi:hypothetical protein